MGTLKSSTTAVRSSVIPMTLVPDSATATDLVAVTRSGLKVEAELEPRRGRGRPKGSVTRNRRDYASLPEADIDNLSKNDQTGRQKSHEVLAGETVKPGATKRILPEENQDGKQLSGPDQKTGSPWIASLPTSLVGVALGGFVPLASYTIAHFEVEARWQLWFLVVGGLVYSALTVYQWAYRAFQYRAKAVGFVVLLEGAMTFSRVKWLGLAGLAILMVLNGVSAAASLRRKA